MPRSFRGGDDGDVEVLLGVGVLGVLAAHLPVVLHGMGAVENSLGAPYFDLRGGLTLLFVLAGFIGAREMLSRLAGVEGAGGRLRAVGAFWLDCIGRIGPSAWIWLAVMAGCAIGFNRSGAFGAPADNARSLLAALFAVENVRSALAPQGAEAAAHAYWAVSLLVQFCLFLPVAALLCGRRLAVALVAAVLVQVFRPSAQGDIESLFRTDGLCLGALLAIWARGSTYRLFEPTILRSRPLWRALVPLLLLALFGAVNSPSLHIVAFVSGIGALLCAALVWLASFEQGYVVRAGSLPQRLLAWVGSRASVIYLAHIPAYLMAREIWFRLDPLSLTAQPPHQLRFLLTALALLLLASELNYRLVETPLRRIRPALVARLFPSPQGPADALDAAA